MYICMCVYIGKVMGKGPFWRTDGRSIALVRVALEQPRRWAHVRVWARSFVCLRAAKKKKCQFSTVSALAHLLWKVTVYWFNLGKSWKIWFNFVFEKWCLRGTRLPCLSTSRSPGRLSECPARCNAQAPPTLRLFMYVCICIVIHICIYVCTV